MLKKYFLCRLVAVVCVGFIKCQAAEELAIRDRLKAPMEELNTEQRLHLACYLGMLDLVKILVSELREVSAQLDINVKHTNGLQIHTQAKQGQPVRFSDFSTPLHEAAAGGHVPVVAYLIEQGANMHAVTTLNRYTCLHLAAAGGWLPVARFLVEHGAEVDALDRDHVTPLFIAVAQTRLSMARLLLELGADVNARDREKRTPIYAALKNEALEKVKCLVRSGADLSVVSADGQTPLQCALRRVEEIEGRHQNWCIWLKRWLIYLCGVKCDKHFDLLRYLVRNGCQISGADRDRMKTLLPHFDIDAARRAVPSALDEVHESTGFSGDLCGAVSDFLVSREHAE